MAGGFSGFPIFSSSSQSAPDADPFLRLVGLENDLRQSMMGFQQQGLGRAESARQFDTGLQQQKTEFGQNYDLRKQQEGRAERELTSSEKYRTDTSSSLQKQTTDKYRLGRLALLRERANDVRDDLDDLNTQRSQFMLAKAANPNAAAQLDEMIRLLDEREASLRSRLQEYEDEEDEFTLSDDQKTVRGDRKAGVKRVGNTTMQMPTPAAQPIPSAQGGGPAPFRGPQPIPQQPAQPMPQGPRGMSPPAPGQSGMGMAPPTAMADLQELPDTKGVTHLTALQSPGGTPPPIGPLLVVPPHLDSTRRQTYLVTLQALIEQEKLFQQMMNTGGPPTDEQFQIRQRATQLAQDLLQMQRTK